MMKKFLFLPLALIIFSCNNTPKQQSENAQDNLADATETEVEVEAETQTGENLPPRPEAFSWFFLECEYTGTYNANQFSKEQLENTLKWLIEGQGTSKPFSIYRPDDLARIDKEEIEKEFDQTLKNLKSLDFINTPYFSEIRQKRIKEVERVKKLSLIQIESFSNPEVLKNDDYSKNQCSEYTDALLAGGDQLLAMRKKMAEASRDEGNSSAWERYVEETESEDEMLFARVFVTTFGWWNCVNESIDRIDPYKTHNEGFKSLFEDITEECEEYY